MLPDTAGLPNVLDCMIPYGLLRYCLYCFSNDNATAPPNEWPITVSIA